MKVVFIVVDSFKSTAPGFGGGPDSPFLDHLAQNGTVFEQMFASGAWTTPSLMAMLTGCLGHRIGIARWRHPFPAKIPTLLTAFAEAGFEVNCFHPYPRWGFLTVPDTGVVKNSQDPDDIVRTLKSAPGSDQFVLIHHWWTHLPYANRELSLEAWHRLCDFQLRSLEKYPRQIRPKLKQSYLKTVQYFSQQLLNRYLDAATAGGDDVLLVVTGDHGETWGESHPAGYRVQNVYDLHGRWISDETVQVPLLFYGKGIPAAQRISGFARGVDLAPTICALSGIPWPGPAHSAVGEETIVRDIAGTDRLGVSLSPSILSGEATMCESAPTVSSHNAFVPRTYPDSGPALWRMLAERTRDGWHIWDGVDQIRSTCQGKVYTQHAEATDDALFARLEAQRLRAVDPGALVSDAAVEELRNSDELVAARLHCLGYLE